MIDANDKTLTNNYLVKPDLNKEIKFKVLSDGSKIQKQSKNSGDTYIVYELKVLQDGELEARILSVFSSEYKKMIVQALGSNWIKLSNPSIVGTCYKMKHTTEVTKKFPEGHDVLQIMSK